MSYSNQLTARRLSSSQRSTPRGDRAAHGSVPKHRVGSEGGGGASHHRRNDAQAADETRLPWNRSVRTDSPVVGGGRSSGKVNANGSPQGGKDFGRRGSSGDARGVRRRLASSLDIGDYHAYDDSYMDAGRTSEGAHNGHPSLRPYRQQGGSPRQYHEGDRHWMSSGDAWHHERQPREETTPNAKSFNQFTPRGATSRDSHPQFMGETGGNLDTATAAALGDTQLALYSQLQDVVVRLSKSAVDEKRSAAHLQRRLEAYASLAKEQDSVITELRNTNASLERERAALLEFRRRGVMLEGRQGLEAARNGRGYADQPLTRLTETQLDDWMRGEYDRCNFLPRHTDPHQRGAHPVDQLSPRTRNLVRSFAIQLHDERARRLDVEEQSSRLIGEQQLMLSRLESMSPRASTPKMPRPVAERGSHSNGHGSGEYGDAADSSPVTPSPSSGAETASAPYERGRFSRSETIERGADLRDEKPPLPPVPRSHSRATSSATRSPRDGLTPGTPVHDEAEAILADIRQRYNL